MNIIEIAGKSYYAGLSWQTLSATDNIKERLKEFGSSGYYCIRNIAGLINLGYSDELDSDIKYKKLLSLASSLADAKKEPWMGVFNIGDGLYWYIAVRDNQAVIPDADIIGTKEEIDKVFEEHVSIGDWESIIENGNLGDIKELLTDKGSYVLPVQKINYPVIIIAGVIMSIAILYVLHSVFMKTKKPEVFMPKLFVPKKTVIKIPGYKTMPKARYVLGACKKEMSVIPLSYYGWKPSILECTGNNIAITYRKQEFGTTLLAPKGTLLESGREITKNIKLNLKKPVRFGRLLPRQKAVKLLYGYLQEFGINGNISQVGNKYIITLNTDNLNILPLFFNIPSFRIISIKITGLPLNERINVNAEVWHD
jgi:hypothetical protein